MLAVTNYFKGIGETPKNSYGELPYIDFDERELPKNYTCSDATAAAVNTAIVLGLPLLVTGEPGCGKSRLADRVAWEVGFPGGKPIKLTIKSTTEASDLFYSYDTVGRFSAAQGQLANASKPQEFIRYQGLGLAILLSIGKAELLKHPILKDKISQAQLATIPDAPQRSVVLIDEIDKAPREVPNDLLTEIENMQFLVPELNIVEPIKLGSAGDDKKRYAL